MMSFGYSLYVDMRDYLTFEKAGIYTEDSSVCQFFL